MQKMKLPIGIEDFTEMRTEKFYLVDKTRFIKELLENWGKVNLFTRPRRFGKSMNMSMLKAFFEIGCRRELFDGLAISKEEKICKTYMGQFPVISITLKDVEGLTFESACGSLRQLIGREATRFSFLEKSEKLTEMEKTSYKALVNVSLTGDFTMSDNALESSLKMLSQLLSKHYRQKVIILIDEYDVPLDKANQYGYYEQMVSLIRKLFNNALKTNEGLQMAVMTGCLRVSKESIFTGLNNLNVISITNHAFCEYFGFTDREVRDMLDYYGFMDAYELVKEWYDGYRFGGESIYCPWDVMNYCYELKALRTKNPGACLMPKNYWANTSGNAIIRALLKRATGRTKSELEQLLGGEILEKRIEENLTYNDLYNNMDNIWSVLFATGYLTCEEITEGGLYRLRIPNQEIRSIYVSQIMNWFEEKTQEEPQKLNTLCDAVLNGKTEVFQSCLNDFLKKAISIRDTAVKSKKENFYHGILLGMHGDTRRVISVKEISQYSTDQNHTDETFMREAIRQAKKAYALEEVPIGCVIVYEGKIIGRGYNRRTVDKNTLAHAELQAIKKASKKLNDWRLDDCTMYVTLEPCQMCAGAIVQARIRRVVVGCMNPKAGCAGSILNLLDVPQFNHQAELTTGVLEEECSTMMKTFFRELREKQKQRKGLK